jgi:capsular exopolysaccharide synthesis family protein
MENRPQMVPAPPPASWTDKYLPDAIEVAPQGRTTKFDLTALRGFLWRQRLILIGVTALMLLAALVLTLLTTPIYEAQSVVRVDPEEADIFQGESLTPVTDLNQLDSYLATLAKVIESRSMAAQVVDSLKLDRRPDFMGEPEEGAVAGASPVQLAAKRREAAIEALAGSVDAVVPKDERLITISYQSANPKLAAEIANSYAENFLTDDLRRSLQKNAYAQSYLNKEITEVRVRLDEAERGALAYARSHGIVGQALITGTTDTADEATAAPQTVTATNLVSVNTSLAQARNDRIAAEQRWRSVANTPPANLPEFQANSAVQGLLTERTRVAAELAEQRERYGPSYPAIGELEAQIAALDRQIALIGNQIKAGIRNKYTIALGQEQALSGELNRVSAATLDEQDSRVAFNQLNGEAQALRTQLKALLERYNQISASANVKPSTITLLDRAILPETPVSPNLFRNLLVALVLGGGLALGLAVVRETLDDRLRSADDVERKLGVPLLGLTPLVDAGEDIVESAALTEAYSSIRAAVDFALPHNNHNVIQLTSSQSVEGKTTTAIAVAREYARLGRKVLLIDADLRRPSVAKAFGLQRPKKGFAEVLAGDVRLEEVILDQPLANLDVVPVGAIPPNPVEVISSQRLDDFIAQYREKYDLIVIDSPPIMGIADAPLLSRVTDGAIFVVESNRAHFGQAKTALRRLRDADARVLGVVLTKFRALDAGQSYGYNYDYYTYRHNKTD